MVQLHLLLVENHHVKVKLQILDVYNLQQIPTYLLQSFFPIGKFTSTNILEKYEDEFNQPVKLSVISTYLSRFASKGRVERARTGREWTYQSIKIIQKQQ
ncbi:hypothetical protein OAQ30_01895 [Nitrosopumilus sp.]|nr:hypothetical protein [Nitrosopumilus sp.]